MDAGVDVCVCLSVCLPACSGFGEGVQPPQQASAVFPQAPSQMQHFQQHMMGMSQEHQVGLKFYVSVWTLSDQTFPAVKKCTTRAKNASDHVYTNM